MLFPRAFLSVLVLALTPVALRAQTCTFVGPGPDVIVGDITAPANYAVAGGMDACALGTTSCNIGTAVLNFFANTANHPLISCGVYRYKVVGGAGRFEHYKVVDPSFHNWNGLAYALRGQQISDFPLCNKSFNLSYCGHDL